MAREVGGQFAGTRPVRAVRAGAFATASIGLGVAAHHLGGGVIPPFWQIALVSGALFAVAWPFTRAERRLPVITGLVLVTQTLMHVGLTAAARPTTTSSNRSGVDHQSLLDMVLCRHAGRALSSGQLAAARSTLAGLHITARHTAQTTMHTESMMSTSMAWMLAAHLAAAAVMAWWLARGERALFKRARQVVETIEAVAQGLPGASVRVHGVRARRVVVLLSPRWSVLCTAGRAPPRSRLALQPAAA